MKICKEHGAYYGVTQEVCPWCEKEKIVEVSDEKTGKEFSFKTVDAFDEHVASSIFGYVDLHEMICKISKYFIEDDSMVYDVGCSTGTLLRKLELSTNKESRVDFIGIEPEQNFFKNLESKGRIRFIQSNAVGFEFKNASFITSVFCLQFISKKYRRSILSEIFRGLHPGGAFILAEKVRADSSIAQDVETFAYYDEKGEHFAAEQILNKERSLRSMLKPISSSENDVMLTTAGFKTIDLFWKRWAFEAKLCVKGV